MASRDGALGSNEGSATLNGRSEARSIVAEHASYAVGYQLATKSAARDALVLGYVSFPVKLCKPLNEA